MTPRAGKRYLAAHLLGLQVLVVIGKWLRELPFEGSEFLQRSTDASLTPVPVLHTQCFVTLFI